MEAEVKKRTDRLHGGLKHWAHSSRNLAGIIVLASVGSLLIRTRRTISYRIIRP